MISSDLPEVINMSDRIYVMRLGAISGHFRRGEASEEGILARMLPDTVAGDEKELTSDNAYGRRRTPTLDNARKVRAACERTGIYRRTNRRSA